MFVKVDLKSFVMGLSNDEVGEVYRFLLMRRAIVENIAKRFPKNNGETWMDYVRRVKKNCDESLSLIRAAYDVK